MKPPVSLWSAVFVYQLMLDRSTDDEKKVDQDFAENCEQVLCYQGCQAAALTCVVSILPWGSALLVAIALQVAFITYIFKEEDAIEVCSADWLLRLAGTIVLTVRAVQCHFVAIHADNPYRAHLTHAWFALDFGRRQVFCLTDIFETISFAGWIRLMKTTSVTENLQLNFKGRGLDRKALSYASGFSMRCKMWMYLLLVLPKLLLGTSLWWFGARFIVKSTSNVIDHPPFACRGPMPSAHSASWRRQL